MWGVLAVALVASLFALVLSIRAAGDPSDYRVHVVAIVGACLLPMAAVRWSESSSIIAMATVVLVAAAAFVLKGMNEGAMVSFSHLLIRVLTTGFLLSYLPMIRALEAGKLMTWAFLLSLAGLYLADRLSIDRLQPRFRSWLSPVAGTAAAVAFSVLSLLFLPDSVSLVSMVVLGLTVSLGGLVGKASENMISGDPARESRIWRGLGPLLHAAPAFFYAFHLYLT